MKKKVIESLKENPNDFASCQFIYEKFKISDVAISKNINIVNQKIWSWIWKK